VIVIVIPSRVPWVFWVSENNHLTTSNHLL
jgi:hypothetical protein